MISCRISAHLAPSAAKLPIIARARLRWRLWGLAGESSLIGGSFFLSRSPCIFGVVSKPWLALLPLHYDSLELTAEIFPSRVLVLATTSFRNYLAINHFKHRPLDTRSSLSHSPHAGTTSSWRGTKTCRSPVKALFASRRSPSLSFAANIQVTTITLLPLQHSHLEPSFSTFSNLPCPPCKTVGLHRSSIDYLLIPIYSLLKYLSPLKNVSIHFVHCLKSL
jgi:hypothetical protein